MLQGLIFSSRTPDCLGWLQFLWSSVFLLSKSVPLLSQISDDRQEGHFESNQKGFWFLLLPFCCCCSVAKSCPTLHNPMDCSTPGSPVLHYIPEFAQIHVHPIISSSVALLSFCLQVSQHQVFNYHWIFIYVFFWSVVDLQCYVSFRWLSYTYTCYSSDSFPLCVCVC